MSSCKTDSKKLTVHPEVVGCRGNQRRMGYASYNARKPDCRPGARTYSALLRVGTSRCDVPARVQRAERLATNPRSAPERRGDAAARRLYLAKQKPVPPPGATRHRQLVDARSGSPEIVPSAPRSDVETQRFSAKGLSVSFRISTGGLENIFWPKVVCAKRTQASCI